MVVTLYKLDLSPPVRAVLMTVELINLKIETKEVNTLAKEQYKPEYLEKNPTHTIPMIEEGDFILSDSHAIITYLVSKYGANLRSVLYPENLEIRASIDHRLYVDATLLFPKIQKIFVAIVRQKAPGLNAEQIEEATESYGFLEKYLERSSFLAADHLTLADISAVSSVSSLNIFVPVDPEKFPKLTKWWKKIEAENWYQKANVPGLTGLENFIKSTLEDNVKLSN